MAAITSFSTLKTNVADWLDRSDMGDAIDVMIGLCEAYIYRDLRIAAMEASFSDTIASGVVAKPTGFLEWKSVWTAGTPIQGLEAKSLDWILQTYPLRSADSRPLYIAQIGSNFEFGPYPDSAYTVTGVYYKALDALSTSNETNWFTTNAPDVLLYGTLVHSAPYIGHDGRAAMWGAAFQVGLDQIRRQEEAGRFSRRQALAATPA